MYHTKIFRIFYSLYLYKRGFAKHIYKMQFKSKKFKKYRTRIVDFIDIFNLSFIFFQQKMSSNFLYFMRTHNK